jgi:hypothetical protein
MMRRRGPRCPHIKTAALRYGPRALYCFPLTWIQNTTVDNTTRTPNQANTDTIGQCITSVANQAQTGNMNSNAAVTADPQRTIKLSLDEVWRYQTGDFSN